MNPACILFNLSNTSMDWVLAVILKDQNYKATDSPITWSVATKYYTAEVDLHQIAVQKVLGKDEHVREIIDNCEAVIFYLGLSTNLEQAAAAWDKIQTADPGVCLLVVDSAEEPSRTKLLDWCLANQFELVECDEDIEEEGEDRDNVIQECTGKERVAEALEAHTWSNLKLVDEDDAPGGEMGEKQDSPEKRGSLEPNIDAEIDALLEGHNAENGEDTNFEDLFSQFASIRDRSANLNQEERKAYAEKVAIAFWKSMGGSDDEIDGVDDLSD